MADPRDAAEALRVKLREQVASIENDARLSKDAKLVDVARAYLAAQAEMRALAQKFADSVVDYQRTLERSVFGAPETAKSPEGKAAIDASYRDAVERADQCKTGSECLGLLQRADRMGDEAMARACVMIAAENGWGQVIDAYGDTRPADADKIRELASYRASITSPGFRFNNNMQFGLPKPIALSAYGNIEALASQGA